MKTRLALACLFAAGVTACSATVTSGGGCEDGGSDCSDEGGGGSGAGGAGAAGGTEGGGGIGGAPASGIVSKRQVEIGQLVQPGQPLLSVVADTGIYVTANLKETQLDEVRVGEPVELEVDAYGGCRALGTVESISGATGAKFSLIPPENATGNFTKVVQRVPVRITVTRGCGEGRPLRPGISVEAHIDIRRGAGPAA